MNELEQPFFVGHNNQKRFPYARYGYLPALEERSKKEAYAQETEWSSKQWDVVNQLRAGYIYLQKKVNQIYDKRKGRYYK